VNDELKKMWKEVVMPILRYYPGICLEVLQKTNPNKGYEICLQQ
jgi:hypothetical protein